MFRNLRCSVISALLLLFGAGFLSAQTTPEIRGIWVDTWSSGFKTAAQIDQLVLDAQRGNLNAIFAQVRRRGDAFYNSTVEPKNTSVSPSSFDPLAYLIQKAHAANPPIEVHAWIITYPLGSSSSHPDHILNKHPDWLTRSSSGATQSSGEYWADPAHPGVQQHIFEVAMDIISRYDADGFHFDYVRYPSPDWGYNPVSVARFNERFGRSGTPSSTDHQWLQFRREAVTQLVRRVYVEAMAIKPEFKISAATIGQGGGITSTSQWTSSSAYSARLQDWRAWMEEGILDLNVPMLYYDEQGNWAHGWTNWNIFAKNHKYDRHLAIGPGWYLNTISDTFNQIQDTRQTTSAGHKAEGLVGYNYAKTNNQNISRTTFLNALSNASGPFPQEVSVPEMPWKTTPTHGHIKGIVIANNTNHPFDHATVTVAGPQNRTLHTDANGFYGAVDLPPGTYTLTASMPGAAYDEASQQITVTAGDVTTTDFALVFAPAAEIVIDDTDAIFSGNWPSGTNPSQFGSGYRMAWPIDPSSSPTAVATFRPTISIPGTYEIYTWYVSGSNRSPGAPYTINHSGGQTTVPVDQRTGGGEWQLLASGVHFAGGNDGYVRIGNNAVGSVVIADAVRFTLLEADPDPADFFEDPVVHTGATRATVTWETVEPAVVHVEYGLSQISTELSPETTTVTGEHSVTLMGMQSDSQYQLRLHARAGTQTYASNWYTFDTKEEVEVIVDNAGPGITFTGSWSVGSWGSFYGSNYHRSFTGGATATFRPTLPVTGLYDVYTWYTDGSTWGYDLPHLIQHADGQDTVLVDQRTNGGQWRLLASGKRFTAGTSGFVRVTNNGSGTTIADAHRWVLRDSAPEHTLVTNVDGNGSVPRAPLAATYEHGSTVQVTATPDAGWVFSHWEGDIEGTENPASILLYRDREITAVFRQNFELKTATNGEGSLQLSPDQETYPAETEVEVLAVPAPGWAFIDWSGDVPAEDNPALVWMDGNKSLTANFGFSYDAWSEVAFTEAERGDPTISGPAADPFGHNIPNILKYAFGMDLEQPDRDRLPSVRFENDQLVVTYYRLRHEAGIQYEIEVSADLSVWEPANGFFTETAVEADADGRTERVTLESAPGVLDGNRHFVRIEIR